MSILSRFVGLDLHKHFVVVAVVDVHQQVVLQPRRISLDDFPAWAAAHLGPDDAVVLEATGNTWYVYDLLAPLVGRCVVANPLQVKWIAHAAVKTDKHDAVRLAKLLAANLIPEVGVPPPHVRELRALLAHRRALVKQRTAIKNRLHSALHRQQINPPTGDPFAAHNREWWLALDLSPTERLRVRQDMATLDHVEQQLDAELARLSTQPPWSEVMPFLIQIPGLALLSAMTILAAVGDISRFPSPKHLVAYAGLAPPKHPPPFPHHARQTATAQTSLAHDPSRRQYPIAGKASPLHGKAAQLTRSKNSSPFLRPTPAIPPDGVSLWQYQYTSASGSSCFLIRHENDSRS
ncbi:MAG: IS110 family transposase [Moorellales bacterium]